MYRTGPNFCILMNPAQSLQFAASFLASTPESEGLFPDSELSLGTAMLGVSKDVENLLHTSQTTSSREKEQIVTTFETGFEITILPKIRGPTEDNPHGRLKVTCSSTSAASGTSTESGTASKINQLQSVNY